MNAEGVVLSEWERSPQGKAISAMQREVISGARSLRSDAIQLKSLFGMRYGMPMPAEEYKATVKERMELTAVVYILIDYLSYAERTKKPLGPSGPDGPVADSVDGYKILPGEEE